MNETADRYEPRLTRLDSDVRLLSNEMGGVKAQLQTLGTGQDAIFAKLESLGGKLENNRIGVGAIWTPLGVMTAILLAVGGVVGAPYIQKIADNSQSIAALVDRDRGHDERITQLRIRQAVLEDRSGKPIAAVE